MELLQNKTADFAVSGLMRNALSDNFYAVRRTALDHLRGYRGPSGNAVRAEIQRLATADPSSVVRAQALVTLASFPNENYATTYQTALRDSSYAVESAAIEALAKLPSVNARAQIATLENTPNSGLVVAIASYYAQRGSIEQYNWFLRRLPDLTDADLYTYLQAFGAFMVQMPVIEREKGIKTLESIARTHPQYVVRLGAYRGLMTLAPSQPDLKSVLLDIKTKETDDRLKAYYNLM
jgi:aminopeptidase N